MTGFQLELLPAGGDCDSPLEASDPRDARWVKRLTQAHRLANARRFAWTLREPLIRISRRMRRKLGHYAPAQNGAPAEIAIARRHISRDAWEDVLHTLHHEMVHQWQDENGLPLAHDPAFRRKAREIGIDPRATRIDDAGETAANRAPRPSLA